ncbi:hypothetical protein [Nocardia sp. BMG111209]|uniref:hypothetical protein n=1 Tax=Nocardia sp. BMG111209 TaxID=1160137 RepID=UPI00036DA872|nr:hypothetical protein [Nocardia sp. BMG111209]
MTGSRIPMRVIAALRAVVAAGSLAVACTASTITLTGPTEDAPRPAAVRVQGAGSRRRVSPM